MAHHHRLLAALGVIGGALACVIIAFVVAGTARADDCDDGSCTLISGGDPVNTFYSGFRPLVTDWFGTNPVDVQVTPDDGSDPFVSGSYNVWTADFKSAVMDTSLYHYSDFTPAADNTDGIDSDGLAGTSVYNVVLLPSDETASGEASKYLLDSLSVLQSDGVYTEQITTAGGFEEILQVDLATFGSADFIVVPGQDSPIMLWDTLPDPAVPDVSDVLPPDGLLSWT